MAILKAARARRVVRVPSLPQCVAIPLCTPVVFVCLSFFRSLVSLSDLSLCLSSFRSLRLSSPFLCCGDVLWVGRALRRCCTMTASPLCPSLQGFLHVCRSALRSCSCCLCPDCPCSFLLGCVCIVFLCVPAGLCSTTAGFLHVVSFVRSVSMPQFACCSTRKQLLEFV